MVRLRGFTLVEVLVALAVLALAIAAAVRSNAMSIATAQTVRLKLLSDWVAENRLEEHRARRDWLVVGETEGDTEQDGEALRWRETVSETPNPRFRRLQVRVYQASRPGEVLTQFDGFLLRTGP